MRTYFKVLPLALAMGVTGCASMLDGPEDNGAGQARPGATAEPALTPEELRARAEAEARGAELGEQFQGHPLEDPESLLSKRTVYFAFDSAEIREEDREVIAAHARYLADHPQVKLLLEGHTDERGSREYNLALGERRANSVAQMMKLHAVAGDQVDVVSFGEERPTALGHDESAWQYNRRVEILYPGH